MVRCRKCSAHSSVRLGKRLVNECVTKKNLKYTERGELPPCGNQEKEASIEGKTVQMTQMGYARLCGAEDEVSFMAQCGVCAHDGGHAAQKRNKVARSRLFMMQGERGLHW